MTIPACPVIPRPAWSAAEGVTSPGGPGQTVIRGSRGEANRLATSFSTGSLLASAVPHGSVATLSVPSTTEHDHQPAPITVRNRLQRPPNPTRPRLLQRDHADLHGIGSTAPAVRFGSHSCHRETQLIFIDVDGRAHPFAGTGSEDGPHLGGGRDTQIAPAISPGSARTKRRATPAGPGRPR
jgi:hypothetical protein